MILDAYTFCWNEQIRLKYFLNHYAPMCRKVTIFDNGSTDDSERIARQYENVVWDTTAYGQNTIDDYILKHVKNNCWKQSRDADWVFVGDVDEILYHQQGFEKYLKNKKQHETPIIKATGYNMISKTIPTHTGNIFDHIDFKQGIRAVYPPLSNSTIYHYDKCLVFSPQVVDEINYGMGSHDCFPSPEINIKRDDELKLLHYKFINKEFYCSRNLQLGSRLCEKNIEKELGSQYLETNENSKKIFDQLIQARKYVIQ